MKKIIDNKTPFEYLDYANIVKARNGEFYIVTLFSEYICFINEKTTLGTDGDYNDNLKYKFEDESLDIIALYECDYNPECSPFQVLKDKRSWELIWSEELGGMINFNATK